jgi:hypothetical protein
LGANASNRTRSWRTGAYTKGVRDLVHLKDNEWKAGGLGR